ncbi:hypothetical protein [Chryseobacterium profundimaris]|nr:hypothetical protein [Chryseobacterium profundimaris]
MHFQLPVQIHALLLEAPEQIIGQDIVFENIPWFNQQEETFVNSLTPFVSQSVIPRPFSNDNLITLGKGMHLHWSLPSLLKTFDEYGTLPEVPNRWLVIKEDENGEKEEWIIESDYIWDINTDGFSSAELCSYPIIKKGQNSGIKAGFEFRYVGRKYPKTTWKEKQKAQYLEGLTALGWGSFSFNNHYANCRSIFGFYDDDFNAETDSTYTIIGYYSENKKDQDYFKKLIHVNRTKLKDRIQSLDLQKMADDELFRMGIQSEETSDSFSEEHLKVMQSLNMEYLSAEINKAVIFDADHAFRYFINRNSFKAEDYSNHLSESPVNVNEWKINSFKISDISGEIKTICLGVFEYKKSAVKEYEDRSENLNISIGNTLPEALTSILLKDYDEVEKLVKEEQLEAILNWGELNDKNLDWVSRLRHKRHENQFKTNGSTRKWEIVPSRKPDENEESMASEIPIRIEEKLNFLNEKQAQLDSEKYRLYRDIESLYLDWHTYLMSLFVYKNEEVSNSNIRVIIEKKLLPVVLNTERKIKTLQTKIHSQKKYIADLLGDQFVLERKDDFHFHEPIPPTVIVYDQINAGKEKSTINFLKNSYEESVKEILIAEMMFDENGFPLFRHEDQTFFEKYTSINSWNIYKMDWEAFFMTHKNAGSGTDFSPDLLTEEFILDDQNADLIKKYDLQNLAYSRNPDLYYGSSFVNDSVKGFVESKLNAFLESQDIGNVQIAEGNPDKIKSGNKQYIRNIKDHLSTIDLLEISLSDFNTIFTQRTSALSIMPLVPNGFGNHHELAATITGLIKKYESRLNLLTPNSSAAFNPFRNGAFKVNRIRLVDTFGRSKILNISDVKTGYYQQIPFKKNWISLPPRLAQPVSVTGKWKKLPGTNSTVLGWLVLNTINNRLEVFNEKGDHLGAFTAKGKWELSPFDHLSGERFSEDEQNDDLNLILNWLTAQSKKESFIEHFIEETLFALKNIQPESFDDPSLLESISTTPIAITRLDVELHLKGGLYYDLSIENQKIFSEKGGERNNLNYSNVKIPVSIGDPNQYNDGCIAYWHCKNDDEDAVSISEEVYFNSSQKAVFNPQKSIDESIIDLDDRFRFSNQQSTGIRQTAEKRESLIRFLTDLMEKGETGYISQRDFLKNYIIEGNNIWFKLLENKVLISYPEASQNTSVKLKKCDTESWLAAAPDLRSKSYLLLMHPKGEIFIKSGILPVTNLQMPYRKIKNTLKKIALTIYTGPLLTPKDHLEITLLKDHRYQWSWIELKKEKNNLPAGKGNALKKIRLTQTKSIDLKKCNIDGNFQTVNELREYLFNQKIIAKIKPSVKGHPDAYIVIDQRKRRPSFVQAVYENAEQKFFDKRWKLFYPNFGADYILAEIINYTSGFKKTLLDNEMIFDAPFFHDEKYIVVTEKYFQMLSRESSENEKVLKRIRLLEDEAAKSVHIQQSKLIDVDKELLIHINLNLRSQEYLQSVFLDPDDFFPDEHIYFINEKSYAEFESIYNDWQYMYDAFSEENLKKMGKDSLSTKSRLIGVLSFSEALGIENIPEIRLIDILATRKAIVTQGKEQYEILLDFFEKVETMVFAGNQELLSKYAVRNRLLRIMAAKEKNFTEKLKNHYKTFEFILGNNQAISSINDFNTINPNVPELMMKEGWLSIKPTNN